MNLSQMKAVALAATQGPWTYDPMGQIIWAESVGGVRLERSKFMLAQVRGWGHLQYLPNGEALQDANGLCIATFNPERILKMCEALEAAKEVAKIPTQKNYNTMLAKLKALEE